MIYYPDENHVASWANTALGALNYNSQPGKIQLFIRKVFEEATSTIRIPGSEVIPVPLFHPLNGKVTEDYIARVEPSASGGRKMAEYILDVIHGSCDVYSPGETTPILAPETSRIDGRAV